MLRFSLVAALFVGAIAAGTSIPLVAQSKVKIKTKTTAASPVLAASDAFSPTAYAATITATDLRQHLTVLASDAMEGRATGEKGQKLAAEYLSKQLAALGLQGPVTGSDNPYLQRFELVRTTPNLNGLIRAGGRSFQPMRDFVAVGTAVFSPDSLLKPVFVGFGIETKTYNDYAGKPDVRGRDVIVLEGEPSNGLGRYLLSGSRQASIWTSPFRKAALARDKGARSITVVSYATAADFQRLAADFAAPLAEPVSELAAPVLPVPPSPESQLAAAPPAYITTIITSGPLGSLLMGANIATMRRYETESYRLGKPAPATFKLAPFAVDIPQQRQVLASENVLGYIEGSDKKEEVLVVSAHYDHIGIIDGKIHNGADDDGSGTAAVLELAAAFAQAKAEGRGPRRSVLFLLNSGEELGLLGSEYYTGRPVQPLAQTVANLNIDMIGRNDASQNVRESYLYIIGSDKLSSELHAVNEAANARYTKLKLDYRYNVPNDPEELYYRSDHYNFARQGVPVIFYTSGLHQDYHKATDDVEKIEFDKLAERARLVFHTAWELANREQRPAVDSNKP
ncbi:M28 family peptidase [Hymenobacter koreensis]|uniref:Peptidase M28 domain-containing protein n=1 Tax=Hymenobacter koreensis TaxID=1084523 RepID=A0ABP8IXA9_9BACT